MRWNYATGCKAKVAIAAIKDDKTLADKRVIEDQSAGVVARDLA
jgi:hypothetical protein